MENDKKEECLDKKEEHFEKLEASHETEIDKEIESLMQTTAPDKKRKPGAKLLPKLRLKKKWVFAAVALVCLAFASQMFMGKGKAAPQVETALLEKKDIAETLSITGPVEGTDSVDVASNLHAKVSELYVKEGDRVEAGKTVLLKIDTEALEKELEIAKGNYELAVLNKEERAKELERSYAKAKQELNTAKADYERKLVLAEAGDIPKVQLDAAFNVYNDAKRSINAFNLVNGKPETEKSLDVQIRNAASAYEQIQDKISDATVIAPISGTVTRVNVKVGRFADDTENGRPMITIENLDDLRMKINISEYSIGKISIGQRVLVSADVLGEGNSVNGEIVNISPTGELKSQGSSERVIPITVSITDKNTKLMAGINAKARIIINESKDTNVVPISAIGTRPDGSKVIQFVLTDGASGKGKITSMEVKTGIESDIEIELLENPMDQMDTQYEPIYLSVYNPLLADGTEVTIK